ncbi:MAG: hypothetical protein Q7S28_00750 [bacterium]|nr:hypothetical protein [bacterium]
MLLCEVCKTKPVSFAERGWYVAKKCEHLVAALGQAYCYDCATQLGRCMGCGIELPKAKGC